MRKLLILHNRPCEYSNLIWRVAIKDGWKTFRAITSDNLAEISKDYDYVRYYGNTLHGDNLINPPFQFHKIPHDIIEQVCKLNQDYTGRWVITRQFKHYGQIPLVFDECRFVKPVYQKYFEAKVYDRGEPVGNDSCNPKDWISLQGIIDPQYELRCFVLNGEILTASYYRKMKSFECQWIDKCPKDVISMVKNICCKLNIPYGIVLDFALLDNGKWVFLEANEAWASGLYDCDPNKCLQVIENSQFTNVIK
jgi:hypothetical protein